MNEEFLAAVCILKLISGFIVGSVTYWLWQKLRGN
jgi:hypothetical protein